MAVRRMGIIGNAAVVSKDQGRHLISYVKATAGLDIAERRRPLEGRWIIDRDEGRPDLRINVIPTLFGEDLTARILDAMRRAAVARKSRRGQCGPLQVDIAARQSQRFDPRHGTDRHRQNDNALCLLAIPEYWYAKDQHAGRSC